jgi:hypothetical protein
MNKHKEWNGRDFIVKPILWAGAARVLAGTNLRPPVKQLQGHCSIALWVEPDSSCPLSAWE